MWGGEKKTQELRDIDERDCTAARTRVEFSRISRMTWENYTISPVLVLLYKYVRTFWVFYGSVIRKEYDAVKNI